jgi:KDO2-lipid IV(A) lauroyltransferase
MREVARRVQRSLVAGAYVTGWAVVRRVPEDLAQSAFRRLADRSVAQRGHRVTMLESNLRRVVGPDVSDAQLRLLVRAGMRSYLRYWCEVFRLPTWTPAMVAERVAVEDVKLVHEGLDRGGVVIALPHSANWDAVGAWIAQEGVPFTTVAERLDPESLYDRFVEYRTSLGMEVLPLTGGPDVFPTLVRRLRDGGLVCLPADRDLTASGVEVDFFGATARMPGGPAALAHATGSTLLTIDLWYDGPVMRVQVKPVELSASTDRRARVAETTQRVADAFAEGIAAHPEDWHMLQPLWVEDVERVATERAAAAVADAPPVEGRGSRS